MGQYECHIKPQAGEQIEATIPLPQDTTALITGSVQSHTGTPLSEALVLLLRHQDGTLLGSTVTDSEGRFFLGPVEADQLYSLRVQFGTHQIRILELALS